MLRIIYEELKLKEKQNFCRARKTQIPVPVTARFKMWVCSRSLAEIVGSTPAGCMDVCLLRVLCVFR